MINVNVRWMSVENEWPTLSDCSTSKWSSQSISNCSKRYTARFSLHQVHGSQCTKEYYTKYSWRTLHGWRVNVKWGTMRCSLLPGTTVNTPQWPWMCPPGKQWQGTFDCPLPWGTSMALGCYVPTVGRCSTTVAHYGTPLQPTCSY